MKEEKYVIYSHNETLLQSIVKSIFMFIIVSFCVYVSKDSTFYTFITGSFLILFVWIRASKLINDTKNVFRNKEELQKWVDSLEGD